MINYINKKIKKLNWFIIVFIVLAIRPLIRILS